MKVKKGGDEIVLSIIISIISLAISTAAMLHSYFCRESSKRVDMMANYLYVLRDLERARAKGDNEKNIKALESLLNRMCLY